ncbi:ATP-binding protein [Cohnella herbarum]|uniref:ATP-binding protein n=1 Tax=Cohnella herbarum TaxID=2728023 RepID=UPI002872C237|nr:ATP-binding protein [Cohnella herbarum]
MIWFRAYNWRIRTIRLSSECGHVQSRTCSLLPKLVTEKWMARLHISFSRLERINHYILTSNKSFGSWGEIFGVSVLATAILDRLLQHSSTINIKGQSCRIKKKKKAVFLKSEPKKKRKFMDIFQIPSRGVDINP